MRVQERADALAYLHTGVDVNVVGLPGSGRTSFLKEVAFQLEDEEFTTRRVMGIESLRGLPLAALTPLGVNDSGRHLTIGSVVDTLTDLAVRGRFVLFVDDADALDDSSWGAILLAQSSIDFRIVTSQLQRHIRLDSSRSRRLRRAYKVSLRPLRLDELERVLIQRADGPIDTATLSRIFAKSSGLPGLATGLFDVGRQEGKLINTDGLWTAQADLWSPTLDRLVERHLGRISRRKRDALEMLSITGPLDAAAARELVGERMLEALENDGFIRFCTHNGERILSVSPPLAAEYFRHTPLESRTARLELTLGETGPTGEPTLLTAPTPTVEQNTPAPSATFVRSIQEATLAALHHAQREWLDAPSGATMRRYLDALAAANASQESIEEVWNTPLESITRAEHVSLVIWRARYCADTGACTGALTLLEDAATEAGEYAPALEAAAIRIRLEHRGYTGDVRQDLPVTDNMPTDLQRELRTVRAYALVSSGTFTAASVELGEFHNDVSRDDWALRAMLHGLILLGQGDMRRAVSFAYEALELARESQDPIRIRHIAYLAGFCQIVQGNYHEVDMLLETALTAGIGDSLAVLPMLGLLSMGAVCALRNGQESISDARMHQAARLGVTDGPLPGMTTSWARSQRAMGQGHANEAIREIVSGADRLWERGARWASIHSSLIELERRPNQERLDALAERINSVDGAFIGAFADYVRALTAGDPDGILETVPSLLATGRPGFVINAYDTSMRLLREAGRHLDANRVNETATAFIATLVPGTFDATRYRRADALLTRRERQIADLVAAGYSNQRIADELVLSVRTVESHLHRIMRKTGVSTRRALVSASRPMHTVY